MSAGPVCTNWLQLAIGLFSSEIAEHEFRCMLVAKVFPVTLQDMPLQFTNVLQLNGTLASSLTGMLQNLP